MGELQADLPLWLYILFGVIYLISRLRKKPAEQTDFPDYGPENPAPSPGKNQTGKIETTTPPKQLTFEELLREISEAKVERIPEKKPVPEVVYESYEDVSTQEEQDLEKDLQEYRKDNVTEVYEEAKRQAFMRPSLEESMNLNDTDTTYGRFKEFEKQTRRNLVLDYLSDFRDPGGLKKAVVMSEILQRKF
jgi:hypothetical protein